MKISFDTNGIMHEDSKKYSNNSNRISIMPKYTELALPEGCPKEGNLVLGKDNLLIFAQNGNVYFKDRLLENDKEIVNGMREFFETSTTVKYRVFRSRNIGRNTTCDN